MTTSHDYKGIHYAPYNALYMFIKLQCIIIFADSFLHLKLVVCYDF